jgi:hypothetical protein
LQLDLVEKKAKNWYEEGAVPSEPFFVPRPGATEEDDGKSGLGLVVYCQILTFTIKMETYILIKVFNSRLKRGFLSTDKCLTDFLEAWLFNCLGLLWKIELFPIERARFLEKISFLRKSFLTKKKKKKAF